MVGPVRTMYESVLAISAAHLLARQDTRRDAGAVCIEADPGGGHVRGEQQRAVLSVEPECYTVRIGQGEQP